MHASAVQSSSEDANGEPLAYSVKNAAKAVDISERQMWELVRKEEEAPGSGVESIKIGRSRRIPRKSLIAYIERLRAA